MKFKKTIDTLIEKYLWQGLTRLLAIYDANDNMLMRFQYADSRLPVAMQSGGATYYLSYDQVGSLQLVTDSSGNIIKALDYDSFGNIIQDTNPLFDMPFSFAGGVIDADTGLIRFGFREYCPEIGRWTAKDPILFLGGSVDLYGYCLNDPINLIDSYGLAVDLNLFNPGTPEFTNANTLSSSPDIFTVAAHGNPFVVGDRRLSNVPPYPRLTPAELANMIRANAKYKVGMPVKLLVCNAGYGDDSFAQKLANELNAKVIAPNNVIWFYPYIAVVAPTYDGTLASLDGGPNLLGEGRFVPFYPKK